MNSYKFAVVVEVVRLIKFAITSWSRTARLCVVAVAFTIGIGLLMWIGNAR